MELSCRLENISRVIRTFVELSGCSDNFLNVCGAFRTRLMSFCNDLKTFLSRF